MQLQANKEAKHKTRCSSAATLHHILWVANNNHHPCLLWGLVNVGLRPQWSTATQKLHTEREIEATKGGGEEGNRYLVEERKKIETKRKWVEGAAVNLTWVCYVIQLRVVVFFDLVILHNCINICWKCTWPPSCGLTSCLRGMGL